MDNLILFERRIAKKTVGIPLNYDRARRGSSNVDTHLTVLPSIPSVLISRRRETSANIKAVKNESEDPTSYDVPKINKYLLNLAKKELKTDDTILALIGFSIILISVVENELFFASGYNSTTMCTYLRMINLCWSLFSVLWIGRRYYMVLTMRILLYQESVHANISSTDLLKPMLIEMGINIFFSPPGFDGTFEVEMLGYKMIYP